MTNARLTPVPSNALNPSVASTSKCVAEGSTWRQWDLHVHTPASVVAVQFGGRDTAAWNRYFDALRALPKPIKVIGINDYIFIEGYRRVYKEWKQGNLPNLELVLPVVELRIDRFGGTDGKLSRVNFHVIFSDDVSADTIEQQFLPRLHATYRLSADGPAISWSAVPTLEALTDLGKQIIQSLPEEKRAAYDVPLVEGFNNFNVSLDSIQRALDSPYLTNRYLTAVGKTEWSAVKWTDGSIAEKKTIINGVNFVFISASDSDAATKARSDLAAAGVNSRLLDCSDAHNYADSKEKDRLGKCCTWIRADPTFEGLRHALNEFDDRVFLGQEPPLLARVRNAPTKTMSAVELRKVPGSKLADPWFDGIYQPLNPGLIAIIGNKGSGKSALLDILGLLGNSQRQQNASFLSQTRFRNERDNKAQAFEGRLIWRSGDSGWISLDSRVSSSVDNVAYVPQELFEEICNELHEPGAGGKFDRELKRVIFSHVREQERLQFEELDDWLRFRTMETGAAAADLRRQLSQANAALLELEAQQEPAHRESLLDRIAQKEAELAALHLIEPLAVAEPTSEPTPEAQTIIKALADANESRTAILSQLRDAGATELHANQLIAEADQVLARLERLRSEVQRAHEDVAAPLERLGVSFDSVISITVDTEPLVAARAAQHKRRDEARRLSDTEAEDGLPARTKELDAKLAELQSRLDEPNRLYAEYVAAKQAWDQACAAIVGSIGSVGSLIWLKHALQALDELPEALKEAKKHRNAIATSLLQIQHATAELLKELYQPVQRFIDDNDVARRTMRLGFFARVQDEGFVDRFLDRIHQGRTGTFMGREEGERRVRSLLVEHDVGGIDGALKFAEEIDRQLRVDVRDPSRQAQVRLGDQLRGTSSPLEMLDFLYGFTYLAPRYGILFGNRPLHELSPGEKGALLLVFYLLVDLADTPLLIDQPEENLDNQTIVELLVPSVREAKQRRQVILVTHNPNLAVVCDADQVIAARKENTGGTRITYQSGALECPEINAVVVDVLEGTRPAFDNRSAKYI